MSANVIDGVVWSRHRPASQPPGGSRGAMVYDAARQRVIFFGGADPVVIRDETREWDGSAWT